MNYIIGLMLLMASCQQLYVGEKTIGVGMLIAGALFLQPAVTIVSGKAKDES